MLSEFFDKMALRKRKKEHARSQRLREQNDKNPPNHKGWSPMINTGFGGLNKMSGGTHSAEKILEQKQILASKRNEIVDKKK